MEGGTAAGGSEGERAFPFCTISMLSVGSALGVRGFCPSTLKAPDRVP